MDRKKKTKSMSDKHKIIIILAVFALVICSYAALDFYYDRTGVVRTEYISSVTEEKQITADGFVIRDEAKNVDGKNTSVLLKSENGIYAPIVSDGESVAKNGAVAYIFSKESQFEAYEEYNDIESQITLLTKLQDSGNISCLDVTMLNSEIISSVREYVSAADSNDFSQLDTLIDNIDYKITSKQIATGSELNFSSEISKLTKQKNNLQKSIGSKTKVASPYAGYFVSYVDGYESLCDYSAIAEDGITPSELNKLLTKEVTPNEKAFGKIISEHTWYYAFNMSFMESSQIKVGNSVQVSFPEAGISQLTMKIVSMTREGDDVAVVMKCVTMNDKLLSLRKEKAVITIGSYSGCKISKEALTTVDDVMGVYVFSGNCAYFKPIEIVYDADDYVIANALLINEEKDNGGAENSLHTLKPYDKVIVKGRNLYDGKVIG